MLHIVARDTEFANPTTDELANARADGIDVLLYRALRNYLEGQDL